MYLRIAHNRFNKMITGLCERLELQVLRKEDLKFTYNIYIESLKSKQLMSQGQIPIWEEASDQFEIDLWKVTNEKGRIYGWGGFTSLSDRPNHVGVMEINLYMLKGSKGTQAGKMLLDRIIAEGIRQSFWTFQTNCLKHDRRLIKLFISFGFRYVGVREGFEKINGIWHDLVLLEKRNVNI